MRRRDRKFPSDAIELPPHHDFDEFLRLRKIIQLLMDDGFPLFLIDYVAPRHDEARWMTVYVMHFRVPEALVFRDGYLEKNPSGLSKQVYGVGSFTRYQEVKAMRELKLPIERKIVDDFLMAIEASPDVNL